MNDNQNLDDSLAIDELINEICEQFEEDWQVRRPQIAEYLRLAPPQHHATLIAELLPVDIAYRVKAGETPSANDYLQQLPQHQDTVAKAFDTVDEKYDAGTVDQTEYMTPPPDASLTETVAFSGGGSSHAPHVATVVELKLVELIGRGGIGEIWRARDPKFARDLAVKVLRAERASDPGIVARFNREADLAGSLEHPGIPPVHDRGRLPDGRDFFAMKLIQGRTFSEVLKQGDATPQCLEVLQQVAEAVGYAHDRGVIHRDLKPANVMVGAFGEVQVMDWGMAKKLNSSPPDDLPEAEETTQPEELDAAAEAAATDDNGLELSQDGQVMGTVPYMPPEQAKGEFDRLDARTDVFALGSMLCEILTEKPVYTGNTIQQLLVKATNGDLSDALSRLRSSGADQALIDLTQQCLAADPDTRPSNAMQVADALRDYERSVRERLETARRRQTRNRVMAVAGFVLMLVLFAWGLSYVQQRTLAYASLSELESDVEATLSEGEETINSLQAKLKDRSGYTELARHPQIWESEVVAAEARLSKANTLLENAGLPVSEEIEARHDALRRSIELAQKDLELRAAVETIRLDAATVDLKGEVSPLKGSREGYTKLFEKNGWTPAKMNSQQLASAAMKSRTPWLWVRAMDDFAGALKRDVDAGHGAWLRTAAQKADPGPWKDHFRSFDWTNPDPSIVTLATDKVAAKQHPELVAVLARVLVEEGRKTEAESLLERATLNESRDLYLWLKLAELSGSPYVKWRAFSAAISLKPDLAVAHVNLGKTMLEIGRLEYAEDAYRRALVVDDRIPDAHLYLGKVLTDSGEHEEAEKHLKLSIELIQDSAEAYNRFGNLAAKLNHTVEAHKAYMHSVRLGGDSFKPNYNMALNLHRGGQHAEAEVFYLRALNLDRDNSDAHADYGLLLGELGRFEERDRHLRLAVELDPENHRAKLNLGVVLKEKKNFEEAETLYREVISAEPGNARAYRNLGNLLVVTERSIEAETIFQRVLELEKKDRAATRQLGELYEAQKRFAEAEKLYREQIKADPQEIANYRSLGELLGKTGKRNEAARVYLAALKIDPKSTEIMVDLGSLLYSVNQFEDAERFFKRALDVKPESAEINNNLATLYFVTKRFKEAEVYFLKSLEVEPDDAMTLNNFAAMLLETGRDDEAEKNFRKAIEVDPEDAASFSNLGKLLRDQKRYAEAAEAYQKSLKLRPDANILGIYATTLEKLDKLEEAEIAYLRALQINDNTQGVHYNLALLYLKTNRFNEAAKYAALSAKVEPSNPYCPVIEGSALFKAGKFEQAKAPIKAALAMVKEDHPLSKSLPNTLRDCDKNLQLEKELAEFQEGTAMPASKQLELANFAQKYKSPEQAYNMYLAAFEAEPSFEKDFEKQHRYDAACLAALTFEETGDAKVQSQCLKWLEDEFKLHQSIYAKEKEKRPLVQKRWSHWLQDPDLKAVREQPQLKKLPDEDHQAWDSFWQRVASTQEAAAK